MNEEELIVDPEIMQPAAIEPNWRSIAWKYQELAKQAHSLADEIKRRDKARADAASASEGVEQYGSTVAALQAELAVLEAAK